MGVEDEDELLLGVVQKTGSAAIPLPYGCELSSFIHTQDCKSLATEN